MSYNISNLESLRANENTQLTSHLFLYFSTNRINWDPGNKTLEFKKMTSITTVPPRDLDFLPDELFLPVTVSLDVTAKGPLKKMTSITTVPPRDLVFLSDEFSLLKSIDFIIMISLSF